MQTALITGGTRGIGWGIAQQLAAQGFHLLLGYHTNHAAAQAAKQALEAHNIKVALVAGDVKQPETSAAFAQAIEAQFDGQLTALVNNAGYAIVGALPGRFSLETYEEAQALYPKAFLRLMEMALPYMTDGQGRVVALSSHGVHDPSEFYAMAAPAKGAMEVLVKHYALALAPRGITVNSISPGYIQTDAWEGFRQAAPQVDKIAVTAAPIGRWGQIEDVAPLVAFLCSHASGFITGQHIYVDGGLSLALLRNSHMLAGL